MKNVSNFILESQSLYAYQYVVLFATLSNVNGKVDTFNLTINPVFIRGGGSQASKGATEKEMVTSSPVVLS